MKRRSFLKLAVAVPAFATVTGRAAVAATGRTEVSILGDGFQINGTPTYHGRYFKGLKIEGMLMNLRTVQGIFDDLNPETRGRWVYPDTGAWDPERNTREFVGAMTEWRRHGVLAVTVCLQGGSPGGGVGGRGAGPATAIPNSTPDQTAALAAMNVAVAAQTTEAGNARTALVQAAFSDRGNIASALDALNAAELELARARVAAFQNLQATPARLSAEQVNALVAQSTGGPARGGRGGGAGGGGMLDNTAIDPDGNLRPAYMARLARILDRADELGMVVIVSYFYFGQDQRLKDEAAVRRGVLNTTNWLLETGHRNVMVEINNEANLSYDHDILKPARVHELIQLVKDTRLNGRRLLVSTSFGGPTSGPRTGDTPVTANVIEVSDFAILHSNGPDDPALIRRMIRDTRGLKTFHTMPVLITEGPQGRYQEETSVMQAAIEEYVAYGLYDQGQNDYVNGYQSPPVNWTINTERKKQFFDRVKEVTGE